MLRTVFVYLIAAYLIRGALVTPLGALQLYLWEAYFRPSSWGYGAMGSLNLSFFAGIWLLVRCFMSQVRFAMDARRALFVLFLLQSMISVLASPYGNFDRWIEFAKAMSVTYLLTVVVDDVAKLRTVLVTIALSLGFEGVKQGLATLILNPGANNHNELPMLGDNNGVAVGMVMLLAVVLGLSQAARNWKERWFWRVWVVGLAYRAISTYSRGAFLSIGTLGLVYLLRSKQKIRMGVAMAVIAGAIFSVLPQDYWDRMSTIQSTEEELEETKEGSALGRLHFWRVATVMASSNPVLGVGFDTYKTAYDTYDFSFGAFGVQRAVHSTWFGILAELGYPGITMVALMVGLAFVSAWRATRMVKRGEMPAEMHHYAVGIQTALVSGSVGAFFIPWQYNEMLWHFIGLGMALHHVMRHHKPADAENEPPKEQPKAPPRSEPFQYRNKRTA